MRTSLVIPLLFLVFICESVYAQNPYIREGSIGKTNQEVSKTAETPFSFRPIDTWIGMPIIFLPQPKSIQKYGYTYIRSENDTNDLFGKVDYYKYVGRIGEVIEVNMRLGRGEIKFKMKDDSEILIGRISNESVRDIGPFLDLENARNKWIGKTLWYVNKALVTYDEDSEKFNKFPIKKHSPVKIIDIVAGWYNTAPIRFIFQTESGEEGYDDINMSGTNVSRASREKSRFEDSFLTADPRKTHSWSEKAWNAIESGKIFIGMTDEQALMAWGKPTNVNRTTSGNVQHEQWVYSSNNYLYFDNGILTSIQN